MSAVLFRCLLPLPLTFPLALSPPALLPVLCHDSPPSTACTVSKPCHVPGTALTKDTGAHLSVRRAISKARGARMGYERGEGVWKDYAALGPSG
ncbi:hypothetical protein B0H16DRAFT_1581700, partial [Mycena metata]